MKAEDIFQITDNQGIEIVMRCEVHPASAWRVVACIATYRSADHAGQRHIIMRKGEDVSPDTYNIPDDFKLVRMTITEIEYV